MPNSDAPVSKTQAIRQYLDEHPDASPRAVAKALLAQGFETSSAFVAAVQAKLKPGTESGGSVNDLLVKLGTAQVDAMFRRQDEDPVDDSEFLPLVEAALNAFETAGIDEAVAEAVWKSGQCFAGKAPCCVHFPRAKRMAGCLRRLFQHLLAPAIACILRQPLRVVTRPQDPRWTNLTKQGQHVRIAAM
jgi:hypothetical protein